MLQLPRNRRFSVLELCVGTGRAAIPIAQAGHRVVGVDYDDALLAIARRKRDSVGLTDRQLQLIPGDVTKLALGQRFDRICIFFNTLLGFPTLAEQDRLLRGVANHLKPTGRFWVDIFNPELRMLANPTVSNVEPHLFHVHELERTVLRTTDIRRDVAAQLQLVTFKYTWYGQDGRIHRQRTPFELTWIFPRELELLLERNGLVLEHLWGNYDGSPVGDGSPRLIASCKLAGSR